MSEQSSDGKLTTLEAGLMALAPRSAGIDRDYLFYHAGRAAARGGRGVWPYTTALMAALAVGLGWVAVHRPQGAPGLDSVEPRIVYVPIERPAPVPPTLASARQGPKSGRPDYVDRSSAREQEQMLRLREQVLFMGVDALTTANASSGPEISAGLDPLLGLPATVLDEPGRNLLKGL
ncbi:MAG: hypothetical protein ACJ8FY_26305 [Gemmataceae bacterium]